MDLQNSSEMIHGEFCIAQSTRCPVETDTKFKRHKETVRLAIIVILRVCWGK